MLIKELLENITLPSPELSEQSETVTELNRMTVINMGDRVRHSHLITPNNPKGLGTVKVKQNPNVWVLPDGQPLPKLQDGRVDIDKLRKFDQGQLIKVDADQDQQSSSPKVPPPSRTYPSSSGLTRGAIRKAQTRISSQDSH